MSQKFLLPCVCGKSVPIESSQAGQMVQCSHCGHSLSVPSLREIHALEPRAELEQHRRRTSWSIQQRMFLLLAMIAIISVGFASWAVYHVRQQQVSQQLAGSGRDFGQLTHWSGQPPAEVTATRVDTGQRSNIRKQDYAGAESCRKCHAQNYKDWSQHPHRWMNAEAAANTVKGDFSGSAAIDYLGGRGEFFRDGDRYLMRLVRDQVTRTYEVSQTIGSRFFQYYVGRLVAGPESSEHAYYHSEFVLPFGYWLDESQWVPTVHVNTAERPDGERLDPFAVLGQPVAGQDYFPYSSYCTSCHTTFAIGDLLIRNPRRMGEHVPRAVHLSLKGFIADAHPQLLDEEINETADAQLQDLIFKIKRVAEPANLGISCEACHLGAKYHAEGAWKKPWFFPASPHLSFASAHETAGSAAGFAEAEFGPSHANANWACARCHSGRRPEFAAGMSTWNSTEYSDAMDGSCYSQLRCIDCHNPHQAIGAKWTKTANQDDALCVRCHDRFRDDAAIVQHTHHPAGTAGSRCMNCHMPRLNEGLQDVVRTHAIFSPTRADMIEANHPNACNLCHTDKPIEWTLDALREWYGVRYEPAEIAKNYSHLDQPAALEWLRSSNEAVRMVGADALIRTEARWALPELVEALDDPFLLNRQFAQRGLEQWLGLDLLDFNYRFYLTPAERQEPLRQLRQSLTVDASE